MEQEHDLIFEPFRLDLTHGRLWRGHQLIALRRRSLAVLRYLAEHPGRVVTKTELRQHVWQETHVLGQPYSLALLAEAYGQMGQPEAGLQVLAEALTLVATSQERRWEAEVYRLQGALLLRLQNPNVSQAEACFQQALAVASGQQATALELRSALSLSRLWQQQGQREAARELLAPIYGWFTEGFDTPDLQEAKALLEELS
jgi:predicted ATPase